MAVSHSDNPYPGGPTPRPRQGGGGGGSGRYQLPSDGFDGTARSGVIRSDGKWIPAEAGNPDWYEYVKWLEESPDNNPDPFLSPDDGGVEIKLEDNQSAVGSMIPSVRELNMPPPVEEPRRIPHRADVYTPPSVSTDASHSPAHETVTPPQPAQPTQPAHDTVTPPQPTQPDQPPTPRAPSHR